MIIRAELRGRIFNEVGDAKFEQIRAFSNKRRITHRDREEFIKNVFPGENAHNLQLIQSYIQTSKDISAELKARPAIAADIVSAQSGNGLILESRASALEETMKRIQIICMQSKNTSNHNEGGGSSIN